MAKQVTIKRRLQSFLMAKRPNNWRPMSILPKLRCADGFEMSVQASQFHYCEPRADKGPWSAVEIGFPSGPLPEAVEYKEGEDDDTGTVFCYVPLDVVAEIIANHGGTFKPINPQE
jgi:hypothetical protein